MTAQHTLDCSNSFFNLRETPYVNLTEIWHNFHMIHLTLIFVKGIFLSCCSVTLTALDSVLFDKKGSMLLTTSVLLQLPLLLFWTSQNDARIPFHRSQCYLIGRWLYLDSLCIRHHSMCAFVIVLTFHSLINLIIWQMAIYQKTHFHVVCCLRLRYLLHHKIINFHGYSRANESDFSPLMVWVSAERHSSSSTYL